MTWKTAIPGAGHSSPVVTRDAVYLTAASEMAGLRNPGTFWRILLLGLCALVGGAAGIFLGRSSVALSRPVGGDGPSFGRLTVYGVLTTVVIAGSLFADRYLDFDRGPERAWLAASLVGTLGMLQASAALRATHSLRPLTAVGLLLLAVALQLALPERAHAYEDGPASAKSVFHYIVVLIPLLAGLFMLATHIRTRRRGERQGASTSGAGAPARGWPLLTWLCAGLGMLAVAGIVLTILAEQDKTRETLSVSELYEPHTSWGTLGIVALVACVALIVRLRVQSVWIHLAALLSSIALATVGLAMAFETLLGTSHYLSYQIGRPKIEPLLGWPSARGVLVVAALAVAVGVIGALRRRAPLTRGGGWWTWAPSMALAGFFFACAMFAPRGEQLARSVICLDRDTGAIRWTSNVFAAPSGILHSDNSAATPTPAVRDDRVFAWFGTAGLACVDASGKRVWVQRQLPYETRHGVATSPIICGDSVIILSDSEAGGYLAAVDCGTGRIVWRTERGKPIHRYAGNCRTPCVKRIDGREVIIVWGYKDVTGYDPVTGAEMWTHEVDSLGRNNNPVTCLVFDEERAYLVGPEKTLALSLSALAGGDPLVWERGVSDGAQCSSPVLRSRMLFAVSDQGTAYCADALTGDTLWRRRLGSQHYASVTAAGSRIYFCDTHGLTVVAACAREYEEISRNDLGEPVSASFACVDGQLFIRTARHLYRIEERG